MAHLRSDPNEPSVPIQYATDFSVISGPATAEYWRLVEKTLTDVFEENDREAERLI